MKVIHLHEKNEMIQNLYVDNPNWENHGSRQTPNKITIEEEVVQGETRRQRPLALSLRQPIVVTTEKLSISLTHSLSL